MPQALGRRRPHGRFNQGWGGDGVLSAIAFDEKAGRSQVDSSLASLNKVFFSRRVATVARLPSALSRSDSFRSVHIGRSRFSRCCEIFLLCAAALVLTFSIAGLLFICALS